MDSIYELYPKISPLSMKMSPIIGQTLKLKRQGSLEKINRNGSRSLMSQYSQICKNNSKEYFSKHRSEQKNKHSHSTLNHYNCEHSSNQKKSAINKVCTFNTVDPLSIIGSSSYDQQPRVQKVISSMGIYDQQLKNAKVTQNKSKRKVLVMNSKRVDQEFIQKSTLKLNDINPESQSSQIPLATKYSNKSMAFKTINLLYKAIIDSNIKHKGKEQFKVQANKLPIIDRFMTTKRLNKFRQDMIAQRSEKSTTLEPLEARATRVSLYRTITRLSLPKEKSLEKPIPCVETKHVRQDNDIVPWSIDEQQLV